MKIRLLTILIFACFIFMSGTIDVANFFNYANQAIPESVTAARRDNMPDSNAITNQGATLGRVLFYDKNLSTYIGTDNSVGIFHCKF